MNLYQDFLNKVEKFIPDNYAPKGNSKEGIIALIENPHFRELLSDGPAIVGIFNNETMGYEYISDNIKPMFGYEPAHFMVPGGMQKVLDTLKPEHAEVYNQNIFPLIFEYFQKCAKTKNIAKHRFTGAFQVKKPDGSLLWCMQQIKVVSTDENMFPLLSLIIISDISDIKKDEDVDFVIACKDEEEVFRNVYVISIPAKGVSFSFSKRELEILSYIKKGLQSKEIAETLIVSEHTVKTHRKNILKKFEGKNMIEIIQLVSNKNILAV